MNASNTLSRAKASALCFLLLGAAASFGGGSGLAAQVASAAVRPDPILERAIAAQRKLVEGQDSSSARATALNDLANLLDLQGDVAAAFENYRAAILADASLASAHYNLALLAYTTGDSELASNHLETAVELEPEHAWAHYQLGRIADDAGEAEKAVEHYARALSLDARLAFGDVNPHFAVNRYATEILLRADRTRVRALPPRTYSEPRRISALLLPALEEEAEAQREEVAETREASDDDAAGAAQGEAAKSVTADRDRPRQVDRSALPTGSDDNVGHEPAYPSDELAAPVTASLQDTLRDTAQDALEDTLEDTAQYALEDILDDTAQDVPAGSETDRLAGRDPGEPRVFTRDDLRSRTLGGVAAVPQQQRPSASPASGRRRAIQGGTPVGPGGRQPATDPATDAFGGSDGGAFNPSYRSSAQLDVTIRRFPAPAP